MSCLYCHSCDRIVDTDDEMEGCKVCLDAGLHWCWTCCIGFQPHECHLDARPDHDVASFREEDENDPRFVGYYKGAK